MRRRTIFSAVAAVVATAEPVLSQHPLVTLPLDDPAYVQLDALVRQGCGAAIASSVRPFTVSTVRDALGNATDPRCAGPILASLRTRFTQSGNQPETLGVDSARTGLTAGLAATIRATARRDQDFRPLWRDVRPDSAGDPVLVGRLRGRVTWEGGPSVVAVVEGFAQSDRQNDPTVARARGFRESEAVVDISEAYVAGRLGPVTVSLGRSSEAWLGEGVESLVLSANGVPMDRLRGTARWSRFEAHALFASTSDVVLGALDGLDDAIAPQRFHRFLAAHALTFRPTPQWEITLGETALLTRRGTGIDLAFVNPVMLFLVAENDSGRTGAAGDDNNLTVFGATRLTVGAANLGAELVIDDIQIDDADRENIPDQLAWRLAGTLGVPLPLPTSVGLEYRRVGSYTFLRDSYAEVYQAYDQPIGSELGPDADLLRASGELWPNGRLRIGGGIGRWRRGAQRIEQRPAVGAFGHAGEPYPSVTTDRPVAQRAWLGDASVQFLDQAFPVTARAEVARIDNVNNQPASSATYYRVSVIGTYRFRFP
ncbi:MAG: hypothetical protein M3373_08440 [Gemmatimonadota bacterium]|nr:hypothetical protein [Gemmatimonadota bacterium]